MTPLDVAMQVGEDKIVRLLKALLSGEPPPQEAPEAEDDDDADDADEAYPVTETSTGAKQIVPSQKAELEAATPEAAEVVHVAAALSKLCALSFSTTGKLGISLEKNVVAKVGEAGTQAADQGVKEGWVLYSIAGTEVEADKSSSESPPLDPVHGSPPIQCTAAPLTCGSVGPSLAFSPAPSPASHEAGGRRPQAEPSGRRILLRGACGRQCVALCGLFVPRGAFEAPQLYGGPGDQWYTNTTCRPCSGCCLGKAYCQPLKR